MNLQHLCQKYAQGGAVRPASAMAVPSREELEAMVAEALGMQANAPAAAMEMQVPSYAEQMQALQQAMGAQQGMGGFQGLARKYADGGAVFGGGSSSSLGGRMLDDGVTWQYADGSTYRNAAPPMSNEQLMSILGTQGAASNQPMQVTHTPSSVTYDTPVIQPTYAPQNGPAFGGSQPASANPNPGSPQNQAPTQPNGSTAPGPAGNGMGIPMGTGQTRYPYMPTTVYQTMPQMSSAGSYFPINYNVAKIGDLVNHLRSQMYA